MDDNLERLLSQKSFEDLSKEKQAYVLSKMTKQEYNNWQKLLSGVTALPKTKPSTKVEHNLRNALAQKRHQQRSLSSLIHKTLTHKISVWQIGLATLLLLPLLQFLSPSAPTLTSEPQVIYINKLDTIYQKIEVIKEVPVEVIVEREVVKWKERPILPQKTVTPKTIKQFTEPIASKPPSHRKETNAPKKNSGRSLKDDAALMDFIVEVY